MWFRCLSFYRLAENSAIESIALDDLLQKRPLVPCGGLDWFTEGWTRPVSFRENLVYSTQGFQMISLGREDKVLPSGVIKYFVDTKVSDIEEKEARKIGRKEKLALKEQITDDLLPRAFTRFSHTTAYLDHTHGWLMVNSATASKAETLISTLRENLPSFSATLPRTVLTPRSVMTDWLLSGESPSSFEWDADIELRDRDENGGVIRYTRMELTTEDIRQQVTQGKQVTKLGLIWRERIRFILTDSLQLTRIQFLDVLQDEVSQSGDDLDSLFQVTFLVMANELAQLLEDLIHSFGGLEVRSS